jgi:hypothetical protein
LDEVEVKIDLCGLDSCHDDDKDVVVHKGQCSRHTSSQDKNSSSSHSPQNNTNNLTSKQFSQEKDMDMYRQVQSGSDLKFKPIQHNLAGQIKSPPMSRKSVQKPRDFDERTHTSVEGAEVHVEDSTRRRAMASMTSHAKKTVEAITRHKEMTRSPAGAAETVLLGDHFLHQHSNGLQAEAENNVAAFFQSGIRCGASSTAALPHALMKPVETITRYKDKKRSPAGSAETVLLGDHFLQQVSAMTLQADPLGGIVSSSESSRLYRDEVHQLALRLVVPVRPKDLAEYVRKLDDKTIDARRAQLRQTIEHCQTKLLGVNP